LKREVGCGTMDSDAFIKLKARDFFLLIVKEVEAYYNVLKIMIFVVFIGIWVNYNDIITCIYTLRVFIALLNIILGSKKINFIVN